VKHISIHVRLDLDESHLFLLPHFFFLPPNCLNPAFTSQIFIIPGLPLYVYKILIGFISHLHLSSPCCCLHLISTFLFNKKKIVDLHQILTRWCLGVVPLLYTTRPPSSTSTTKRRVGHTFIAYLHQFLSLYNLFWFMQKTRYVILCL